VEVEVEAEADMDQSLCQLHNVARANKDPPDPLVLLETKANQEKTAVMVKTEATAKMVKLAKPAADMDLLQHHPVKSAHQVHPDQLELLDPKVHLDQKAHQEARLPTENEENAVKSVLKDHPVVLEILAAKDLMEMQAQSTPSKDPADPSAHLEKMVPKVQSAHPVKTASPATRVLEVEREKTETQVLLANLELLEVPAAKVPLVLLEAASIVQLLVQLQVIKTCVWKMPDQIT